MNDDNGSRPTLVCFPHGGSVAAVFRSWRPLVQCHVDVTGVDYPGRGERSTYARPNTLNDLAAWAASSIRTTSSATKPLYLYGHSFGATVALEIARQLERSGSPVAGLIVAAAVPRSPSGAAVPLSAEEETRAATDELARMGRITSFLMREDASYTATAAKELATDQALLDMHDLDPQPPGHFDLLALASSDDTDIDASSLARWAPFTRARFSSRTVAKGGHLFHLTNPHATTEAVVGWILETERGSQRP